MASRFLLFLFRCFSHLPLPLLYALGWLLGWVAFLASPSYRRRFVDNARQAGYRFAEVCGAVGQAGCMAAELPRLWAGRAPPVAWTQRDLIDAAYARGRGILFLTPHLGCFEISAQAMADQYGASHGPMTVLYRPARKPWMAALLDAGRDRPHLEAVPTTLAGVRQMLRRLREGQAVGLLPDQVPPEGLGTWSPFFGRPAYTMTLAARLAQQTGATVLLARCERLSWGRGFCLHISELAAPVPAQLDAAVAQINGEMERLIRAAPGQYLWGYNRYKQPRSSERTAG